MIKRALTPEDTALIKHYLLGGAAIGGGAAAITSLLNHMKDIRASESYDKDEDDSTLKLKLRTVPPPAMPKMASVRGGVAIVGGTLAAAGAYHLVRSLYQKYKEREAQQELDNAHTGFVDVLDQKAEQPTKHATVPGKPMSMGEHLTSTPVAALLMAMLASGAISYHALKRTFPETKPAARIGPKRVVVEREPMKPQPAETQEPEAATPAMDSSAKYASVTRFLLDTVCHVSPNSQTADLVNAVAAGRFEELDQLAKTAGVEAIYDVVKNASAPDSEELRHAACGFLARHPFYEPVVAVMAAAEFAEIAPTCFKAACEQEYLHDEYLDAAEAISNAYTEALLPGEVKQASVSDILAIFNREAE